MISVWPPYKLSPASGVAEPGKVNADLMGTARYRKQETNAWEALAASTVYSVTLGLPSSLTQRPMMESPRRAIGTSMRPDPTGQRAFHQGKITLLCSLGEFRRGKGILRTQHKAAGVFINAVDRRNTPPSPRHFGGTASRSQGSRWYGLMWGVPQCRQVCSIQPQTHPRR